MYSERLWQHIKEPQNQGPLPQAQASGRATYDRCGDVFELHLAFDNSRIAQAKFQARACGPVVAIGSAGTQLIVGMTFEEALQLSAFTLDELVGGLPPPKRHAILLFLQSLHEAIHEFLFNKKEATHEQD